MPQAATTRFWEAGQAPNTADEFAVLSAMAIAMSARNAVEDLHAAGAYSDAQAPALNRLLRDRAYEALLALQQLGGGHDYERLAAFLAELAGERDDMTKPTVSATAVRSAIRDAVRNFAQAEQLPTAVREDLELAAVAGAAHAFHCLQTIHEPESAAEISYLARMIPSYWELPEVRPELRRLLHRHATTDGSE